jgi:hypothetical protein
LILAFPYGTLAATVSKTLAQFGKSVILRNVSAGVYDPVTAQNVTTSVDKTRKCVMFDFLLWEELQAGGLVQKGDKKCVLEAGIVPSTEDKVIDGTIEYTILSIKETNPAGVPLSYTLHLRR